jgi:replication factor A1
MLNEILQKIISSTGLTEEEVNHRVEDKLNELSHLISEEGAAYIVAKELGVNLTRSVEKLNIGSIVPGIQNVDTVGKITRITKKDFETDKTKGTVASVYITDGTGNIRITLWNDEIKKIENLTEGDVIHIQGSVKDGAFGPEIRIGRYGLLHKTDKRMDIEKPTYQRSYERSYIKDLMQGQNREVRAGVMQVFESNPFYEVCPECGSRVREENEYTCEKHGKVEPSYALIITGIIDDGSGNIRAVFFKENGEKIIEMKTEEARKAFMRKLDKAAIYGNVKLGKEFIFQGSVRRNDMFDRLEFVVNNVKNVDVVKEIQMMLRIG